MPDRQDEPNIHQSCKWISFEVPVFICHHYSLGGICHQYFCNVYYPKCQRQGCLGCLNQLQSKNFISLVYLIQLLDCRF